MRVALFQRGPGLMDTKMYDGELPGYTEALPPKVIVANNHHAFVYADDQVEGAYVYFDAATFHLFHQGKYVP